MSFWKDNPCVPTWSATAIAWWNSAPPRILEAAPAPASSALGRQAPASSATPIPGLTLTRATAADAPEICEFLGRWFTTSVKARCDLPPPFLAAALSEGQMEMWLVRKAGADGALVATLGRRWIRDAAIGQARWPRAGVVDYFAVHPAARGRGVGRWLLVHLQASTSRPIPPHFILWESFSIGIGIGIPLIPPLVMGQYWIYQRQIAPQPNPTVKRIAEPAAAWHTLTRNSFLHSSWTPGSVSVWTCGADGSNIAIQDIFHRSVPDGRRMAMVVAASSPAAVAAFAAVSPWPILLGDRSWGAEWTADSSFQWIGYNVLTGTVTTAYPCFSV